MASPEEMRARMVAKLPEATGRGLDEWIRLIDDAGLAKHGEIVKLLKNEHGVSHGYANMITHSFRTKDEAPSGDDLVAAQYAGAKAQLRPIYDAIVAATAAFGADVEVSPKKAYVSLRRAKQFAIVQPSTRTRVDVGLKLRGIEPTGRLEASGNFNSMLSHRVRITEAEAVDAELIAWLSAAYEAAG